MSINHWWEKQKGETYWLELTDREDLGTDLRAPLFDDSGRSNWRYSLFNEVKPGEIVYHYHRSSGGIVAVSTIAGLPYEHPIVWAARGRTAREKGIKPHERPGYRVPIKDFRKLESIVSATDIELMKNEIRRIRDSLSSKYGAIYFPFELSEKRPARPLQGYAFKLPREFVELFPQLEGTSIFKPTSDGVLFERRVRAISTQWKKRGRPSKQPTGQKKPKKKQTKSQIQYERDPSVKAWILAEANGYCELCGKVSFYDIHDVRFLELHHVKWLSKGGEDTVENAVGLCPNCHRACHHSKERDKLSEALYQKIDRLRNND